MCVHVLFFVSILEMVKRDLPGYAIGGLSGGEKKDIFWKIVSTCTDHLPKDKPRYCMGVGSVSHEGLGQLVTLVIIH